MDSVKPVLDFLKEWKSNREIKEEFNLTQNQFYRLSRWLLKAGFVDKTTASKIGKKESERITFYKVK